MTVNVIALPRQVRDLISQDVCVDDLDHVLSNVTEYEAKLFQVGQKSFAIVPNHKHDLNESNILFVGAYNARQIFFTSLLNGPTATVFEKIDPSEPAYYVFRDSDLYYHYAIWR